MRNSPPVVKSVAMQEATGRQGNPADEVYVCGKVEGKPCKIVLDTGSPINLLDKELCPARDIVGTKVDIRSTTGEKMRVFGKRSLEVSVGGLSSVEEFYVVEMVEKCILGAAFLQKHRCSMDLSRNVLCLPGRPEIRFGGPSAEEEKQVKGEGETVVPQHLEELYTRCSSGLSEKQKNLFAELLHEFQDVFAVDATQLGNCDWVKHTVDTGDHRPIKQAPRRLPLHRRAEVEELLRKMLAQGVIEESQSPWSSPIVLVKKKDGTIRFCVDFRRLNEITKKDSYPLPRIEDTLDALAGSSWFSTVDLQSGYWQISMDEKNREKTAFSVGTGLWQFKVMPFGLCNAPATFERLMEDVLRDLTWKICLVYLDDIIIYGNDFGQELERLRTVFSRLRQAGLLMSPKKCSFFCREVKYLGHIVTESGVKTDPEKIKAISEWPQPKNVTELRSFLGLCTYYRKFVKDFSRIAKPLHRLTEAKQHYAWTEVCQEVFQELKRRLTGAPVLAYPVVDKDFILDTDASNFAVGGVLSQEHEGQEKVVAYFSKTLGKAERNYCVTRRELLAVVKSTEHFHHYLYGRRFLIRTDHAALRWLLTFKCPEGQVARWIERLQVYDFEIRYRAGRAHGNADGLSRRPCIEGDCKNCDRLEKKEAGVEVSTKKIHRIFCEDNRNEWKRSQEKDEAIGFILKKKGEGEKPGWQDIARFSPQLKYYWTIWDSLEVHEGLLFRKWESHNGTTASWLLVVPRERVAEVLKEFHDAPAAGHFGVNKTLAKIRQQFFWSTCRQDVQEWCRRCDACAAKKGPRQRGAGNLRVYNVGAPFERLALDVVGPLPRSQAGNRYMLVVADYFTRWPEVIAMPDQRAVTVARALLHHVVCRHGVPLEIHTDQGRNFESSVFKELLKLLGVKKTRTTPLHPQSDGLVERLNRTLLQYLAMFVSEHQRDWDEWIPMFLLAYRSARHEATQLTPAMILYGQELRLPLQLWRGLPPEVEQEEDVEQGYSEWIREKMTKIHEFVRRRLDVYSSKMKSWYDNRVHAVEFQPGERVWLFQPRRVKGKCPKLQADWEGPYTVVDRINDVVYRIQRSRRKKCKVVHVRRLAKYEGQLQE